MTALADETRRRSKAEPFTVDHFRRWSQRLNLKNGRLFKLEEYQARFLEDLFARTDDGLPLYEELWLVLPEGNGKTTFFTLVVLYTIEQHPEAWVPVAASARDQAVDLTYRIAAGFVERNKLDVAPTGFKLHPGYRQIVHKGSRGAAKIFASDAASGDGVDPTLALIEELHRLSTMDLYETWSGKLDKSGGQLIIASTAGEPGSAFEELRTKIRQAAVEVTRDGCFTHAAANGVVLHEYGLPENGDPENLELVAAANPASWKTVAALTKKRAKSTYNANHWRRFTCNMPTRPDVAAISEIDWARALAPDGERDIPHGAPIRVGIDLGWINDTTAIVPLWVRDFDFRLLGPAIILEPPGDGTQLNAHDVEDALLQLHARNPIEVAVMDMTSGEQLGQWIEETLGAHVIDRGQSNSFAVMDYARFMEGMREGWLRHSGDIGLKQHAMNAIAQVLPSGGTRFLRAKESRKVSPEARRKRVIDALVAAAMVNTAAAGELGEGPADESWWAFG